MRMIGSPALTIKIMREHHGIKLDRLICGRYAGVGRVLDTGYDYDEGRSPSDYNANNPTGWKTGQWISVEVVDGAMLSHRKGEKIEKIWSYGGDTGIRGKPKVGDFVGFYYGKYAQIWEKLSPLQVRIWQRPRVGSGFATPRRPLPRHRPRPGIRGGKIGEETKAAAQQEWSGESMENSSLADRLGSIVVALFVLALGLAGGFYVIAFEWLDGRFPWHSIIFFLIALGFVLYGVWLLYCHVVRFSEKPIVIRGTILNKSKEIEHTYDLESAQHSSTIVGYNIEIVRGVGRGTEQYSLKKKTYDWLSLGDAVELTYFPSIGEVTRVEKVAKRRGLFPLFGTVARWHAIGARRSLPSRAPISQRLSPRSSASRDRRPIRRGSARRDQQ